MTEHPNNPKIFIDTGDPCLALRKSILLSAHKVIKERPENAVPLFKQKRYTIPCLAEQAPTTMGYGCSSSKLRFL